LKRRACLAALLLAGCATVGPNYRRPDVATPAQYAEPHDAQGLSDAELAIWWKRFGDPQLDSLITRAIALNLDVQSAAARIREARARETLAGARNLPTIDAQASATRQRISENDTSVFSPNRSRLISTVPRCGLVKITPVFVAPGSIGFGNARRETWSSTRAL